MTHRFTLKGRIYKGFETVATSNTFGGLKKKGEVPSSYSSVHIIDEETSTIIWKSEERTALPKSMSERIYANRH